MNELEGIFGNLLVSLKSLDDLDTRLDRNRVHKVCGNNAGLCTLSRGGNSGDRNGGCVGSENSILGSVFSQLGENLKLEVWDFRNSLNDHISRLDSSNKIGGRVDSRGDFLGLLLSQTTF